MANDSSTAVLQERAPIGPAEIAAVVGKGRKTRQFGRWGLFSVLVLTVAVAAWWMLGSSSQPAVTYTTRPVVRGDLIVTVSATGTVEPTNEFSISSELSGTIRTVLVDYNDLVEKGAVLARLDTDKLNATTALAEATRDARQADVRQAETTAGEAAATLARTTSLSGKGVSTTQALLAAKAVDERAQAALATAKANLRIAEANLSIAHTDLAKAEILSPIKGVVLTRTAEPGQIVAASFSAPVLFTLAEDLSKMELRVDIDEADVSAVKADDTASFTVEAHKNRRFPATIKQLRLSPATVEGVVAYKAILSVDNADLALRPGMTATADITVNTVKGALLVPNAALRYAPAAVDTAQGNRGAGLIGLLIPRQPAPAPLPDANAPKKVWVLRDSRPVPVAVEVGASDGANTEVTGALKEGDAVIAGSKASNQ